MPGYLDPHAPEYNQHPPNFPYEPGGDKQSYPQKHDSTCLSSSAQAGTFNVSFQKRPGDSIPVKPGTRDELALTNSPPAINRNTVVGSTGVIIPISDSDEHAWIADFCESRNKCVRKCSAGAIYDKKPVMIDGGPKHIDYIKCAMPFSKTMGCSVCIVECVFFRVDYNKIKAKYQTQF